jgi:hypothetical protein
VLGGAVGGRRLVVAVGGEALGLAADGLLGGPPVDAGVGGGAEAAAKRRTKFLTSYP